MATFDLAVAAFLLVNVGVGLVRVARGPTEPDRMLSVQLFGSTGTAVLLLLASGLDAPALRDAALVFAVLAGVVAAAFVRRGWQPEPDESGGSGEAR
jgi:multicomponent Na+:H+ antiporter subunit F